MGKGRRNTSRDGRTGEIAELVQFLRALAGVTLTSAPNLLEVFEALRRIYPKLKLRIVEDSILPNAEARASPRDWLITIKKSVYESLLRNTPGARWTFAHELGHVFLRHPKRPFRKRGKVLEKDFVVEVDAHKFAAEFLVPAGLVPRTASAADISARFKISFEAATRRVEEVRIAARSRATGLRPLPGEAKVALDAIRRTIEYHNSKGNFIVEPLHNDLAGVAILVAACANLLRHSYLSLRPNQATALCVTAGAIAGAILAVSPIREMGRPAETGGHILEANKHAAARAAFDILGLSHNAETLKALHRVKISADELASSYLRPLIEKVHLLLRDPKSVVLPFDLPSYENYSVQHDVSWTDIDALQKLIDLCALIFSLKKDGERDPMTEGNYEKVPRKSDQ